MMRFFSLVLAAFALPVVVGCGDAVPPAPSAPPSLLLAAEPTGSVSVLDAKGKAAGDEVVVIGRVSDIAKGFAAFTLTDTSVEYCGEGAESCGCPTPWDYCCEEERAKASRMPVELRDKKGEPVQAADIGLRLLDLVVVRGTLAGTESGGLMILAKDGWYRSDRPKLPEGLDWP
ncbi:MAG: hypothetical protein O2894_05395 [Planctomycetota bacterium]|nr:hypothetical protein [Planctomycetota bacterium]